MTDPTGTVTSNTYDEQDRVVGQVDPLGNTLAFAYTGVLPRCRHRRHRRQREPERLPVPGAGCSPPQTAGLDTDAPSTTSYVYDDDLALVATVDPNRFLWRTTRDAAGNVLTSTDPLGRTTTLTWNKRNDPTSITTPLGITTRIRYDDRGLVSRGRRGSRARRRRRRHGCLATTRSTRRTSRASPTHWAP